MKIKILIGENPNNRIIFYNDTFKDDLDSSIKEMDLLLLNDNITIMNPSMFLLYHLNTQILRYIVNEEELKDLPSLNPEYVKILEVDENGVETSILGKNGLLSENYFNSLMKRVMDGFFDALNFYEGE